jgi:hypothetical protein
LDKNEVARRLVTRLSEMAHARAGGLNS